MAIDFNNEVVLITGGTGSFGNKFVEILLRDYNPKIIRIFSRGELKQLQMMQKFNSDSRLRFFIGDVRDKNRLWRAMDGVSIVIHAAALKQVPACEYNPIEAIQTNINGAINVIDTAIDRGVQKVIALSTDKAAHPVNLYGATKLVAEKLFVQANTYSAGKNTRFSVARYGNVAGSRGSIIPVILSQRKNGVVTLTDERMTRFWITKSQAVHFILNCLDVMRGGEIFVPIIPSVKVSELIDVMVPTCRKQFIGIRAGEKLHETLLTLEEARHSVKLDNYYVIEPEFPFWDKNLIEKGEKLPEGFEYTSNKNEKWVTKEEIMHFLEEQHDED